MMNVIAVDVGTTSVRLAIINFSGLHANEVNVLASYKKDIGHTQKQSRFEQCTEEIWSAICECSRKCLAESQIKVDTIKSIAFSATCSLVIAEKDCNIKNRNDVIMWMDHRAVNEARQISMSSSKVLAQFGGVCSPEFTLAKLLWLKNNEPERFDSATGFFELPDWLVYRCMLVNPEESARSLCCLTCKWGYDTENKCHCDIIQALDCKTRLESRMGKHVLPPGSVVGSLSSAAAMELGLIANHKSMDLQNKENFQPASEKGLKVLVASSLIDAHSGMLAMLSLPLHQQSIESTFCSLTGTSSCHMLLSRKSDFKSGIWGPYKDVVLDGFYLLEAGQSLTGKLIEICIESHDEGKMRLKAGEHLYEIIRSLNSQIRDLDQSELHVLPSYHGNRSPLANPRLRGGIYGLSAQGARSLQAHYIATVESLAYEMRFIVETLSTKLETLMVSGGLMKNTFFMQTLADVLGCRVVKLSLADIDFMVMGSGLVARHAALLAGDSRITYENVFINKPLSEESIQNMKYRQLDVETYHSRANNFSYHEKKYLCYKEFVELSKRIDKIMN